MPIVLLFSENKILKMHKLWFDEELLKKPCYPAPLQIKIWSSSQTFWTIACLRKNKIYILGSVKVFISSSIDNIHETAKWQFCRNTQFPVFIASLIIFSAIGPCPCPNEIDCTLKIRVYFVSIHITCILYKLFKLDHFTFSNTIGTLFL